MAKKEKSKGDFFKRMLDKVEVIGNKLPQPVTLFAMLIGFTLFVPMLMGYSPETTQAAYRNGDS